MEKTQYYIGLMSGTSMDGVDAVLIEMKGTAWAGAKAHAFLPYDHRLRQSLLALQNKDNDELHRSRLLAQEISHLYAQVVANLLKQEQLEASEIRALGCHGQTVRHAPESGYSIQLIDLALLAHLTGIFTIGDFRSGDLAAGGQGAPLVPAFHQAVFADAKQTRIVLNLGGIANISVLNPQQAAFGFDTGPANMLLDAWTQSQWALPYDINGEKAQSGIVLPELLTKLKAHPYFQKEFPKSTGRELFSLAWLQSHLSGNEKAEDVLRTLIDFTVETICLAISQAAPMSQSVYACGGGVFNPVLMQSLSKHLQKQGQTLYHTDVLNLNPQWVEAAAFAWLAACWCHALPSNPHRATGANRAVVLGGGYFPSI